MSCRRKVWSDTFWLGWIFPLFLPPTNQPNFQSHPTANLILKIKYKVNGSNKSWLGLITGVVEGMGHFVSQNETYSSVIRVSISKKSNQEKWALCSIQNYLLNWWYLRWSILVEKPHMSYSQWYNCEWETKVTYLFNNN